MLSIMKTFLNVLYRRILYKIPLKLLLVLLAIFWLLFACTKADLILSQSDTITISHDSYTYTFNNYDMFCIKAKNCQDRKIWFFPDSVSWWWWYANFNTTQWQALWVCAIKTDFLVINDWSTCDIIIDKYLYQDYSSQQCQSEYNLIPINEVDNAYCESNNLCSSSSNPSDCPNVWISNLFINDIFHPGAFNIIMNIPEEISRDYAYTNSWYNFNLDIEWYNVDYEKMQSVIDSQSYIPTEEDFQNIIAILTPYTKIIVFFVFLFIVWAWIKKPFKSKKL